MEEEELVHVQRRPLEQPSLEHDIYGSVSWINDNNNNKDYFEKI